MTIMTCTFTHNHHAYHQRSNNVLCESPESYSDSSFTLCQKVKRYMMHYYFVNQFILKSNNYDRHSTTTSSNDQHEIHQQDRDIEESMILGINSINDIIDYTDIDDIDDDIPYYMNESIQSSTMFKKGKEYYTYLKDKIVEMEWIHRVCVLFMYAGVLAFTLIALTDETNKALGSKPVHSESTCILMIQSLIHFDF